MTIGQGHDTPLVYGQLSEVSFKSKLLVKSYGLDMDFGCLQCDLDLGDMTLGQDHDTSSGIILADFNNERISHIRTIR